MEDYFLREIDRMGEMLMLIARKLGLLDGELYKIQGCAACYSQCRTILKPPGKG